MTSTATLAEAPARKPRPYVFLGQTTSMCETCLALVPAKIIEEGGRVYYQKRCREHGVQKTLVSSEAAYWKRCRDFLKPGDVPLKFHTSIDKGCPALWATAARVSMRLLPSDRGPRAASHDYSANARREVTAT